MELQNKIHLSYKILFLGETQVGKTSLIVRYSDNDFQEGGLPTLGVDLKYKYIERDKKNIRLDLWDTAGQERFRSITKSYYDRADGIVFVFDLGNPKSFKTLKIWIEDTKKNVKPNIEFVLAANKSDLIDKREVRKEEIEKFSSQYDIPFFETSAKTGDGIDEMFNTFINKLLSKKDVDMLIPDDDSSKKSNKIQLKPLENKNNTKKCVNC